MKKLLVLMMALVMTLSLVACGKEEEVAAPPAEQQEVSDEQAKADADYVKLENFFNRVVENYTEQQEIATLLEEVKSGKKQENAILDVYGKLREDSDGMFQELQNTAWETNHYDNEVAALHACVEALAIYQQTLYEASAENDGAKLETVAGLLNDYDAKLGALLDAMGVE